MIMHAHMHACADLHAAVTDVAVDARARRGALP
eukprot:SAG22_NODE_681_length_7933_cov_27.729257_3_plen_33_part_00